MNFDFYINFHPLILLIWIFEGFSSLPPSHSSVPKAVPAKKRIAIPRPRNPHPLSRANPQPQVIQKRILLTSLPKVKTLVRNPDGSLYGYHEESPAQRKIERPQQFFPLSAQIARERKLHAEEGSPVQTPHSMQNQRNAQIQTETRRLKTNNDAKVKDLEGEGAAITPSEKQSLQARAQDINLVDRFAQVNLKPKLENRADLLHADADIADGVHDLSRGLILSKDDRPMLSQLPHTVKPANTQSLQEEGQSLKSQFPYSSTISSHATQEKLTPKALQSRPGRYGILRDPLNQRLHAGPQYKAEELMKGRVPSVSKAELAGLDDVTSVGSLEQLNLKVKEGETEYAKKVGLEKTKNDEQSEKEKGTTVTGPKADTAATKEKQPIGLPPKTFPAPVGEIQRFPTDLVGGLNLPSSKGDQVSENTFQKINKEIRENNGPNIPNTLKWATAKEKTKESEKARSQSSTKLAEKLPKIPYEILNHQKNGTPKKKPFSVDKMVTDKEDGEVTPAMTSSTQDDTKEGLGKVMLTPLSLDSKQERNCDPSKGSNVKIPSSPSGQASEVSACSNEASQEVLEPPIKRPSSGDQTSTIGLPPQETARENDPEFNKMSKAVYEVLEEMAFEGGSHMVEIKSSGCDDPPANGNDCDHAVGSIKFDGEEMSKGVVGFNLVVMSYPDLVVRNAVSFKTGINAEESQRMAKFLMNLKGDNVICLAAKGDANSAAGQELYDALTLYGMRSPFLRVPRSSLAFVGCRGDCSGPWVQQVQRKPKEGPSVISLVIGPQDEFVSVGGGGNRMFELTKPKEKAAKNMNSGYNAGEKVQDQPGATQNAEQQPKEPGPEQQQQPNQTQEQQTKTPPEQQAAPSEQSQQTQQQLGPEQPPGETAPDQQGTSQASTAMGPSGKAATQVQQQEQPASKPNEQDLTLTQNVAANVNQGEVASEQLAPGEVAPEQSQAGMMKPEEQNPAQGEQLGAPQTQNGQNQGASTPDQVETQQPEHLKSQEAKFTKCQDNKGENAEPNAKRPCSVEGGGLTQGAEEVTHTVSVQETTTPTSQKVKVDEMLRTKEDPLKTNNDASPDQVAPQAESSQGEGMQDGVISIPINPPGGEEGRNIPDASLILHHTLNDGTLDPVLDRNISPPMHGASLAHGLAKGLELHAGLKGIQSRGKTAGTLFPSTPGKQEEMPGNEKEGSGISLESFSQKEYYNGENDHNRLHFLNKEMSLKPHLLPSDDQTIEISKPDTADQELKKIIEMKGKNNKQPSDIAKAAQPAIIPSGQPVFLQPQVDDMGTEAEADNEPLADTIVNANLGSDLLDRAHSLSDGPASTEPRSQSVTKTPSLPTQHLPQNPYYLQRASRKPDPERTQALLKFFRPDFSKSPIVVSHQDIEAAVREENNFSDPPPGSPLPISNPKPESKLQLLQQDSEYQNYKLNPQFTVNQNNKPPAAGGKKKPKKEAAANSGPLFEIHKTMKPNQLWTKLKKPGALKDKDTASLLAAHSYKLPRPHQRPIIEGGTNSNESETVKAAGPANDGSDEQEEGDTNPSNIAGSKLIGAGRGKPGFDSESDQKEVDKTKAAKTAQQSIPNEQARPVNEKQPPAVEKEANENQAGGTQFDEHTLQDGSTSSAAGTGNDNAKETAGHGQNTEAQQRPQEVGGDDSRKPIGSTHAQKEEASPEEASPEEAKDQSSLSNGAPEAVSVTNPKEQEKPDQSRQEEKLEQDENKEKPQISVNIDDSNVTISAAKQQEDDLRQEQTGSPQEVVAGDAVAGSLPTVLPMESNTNAEKERVGYENANQVDFSNNGNESSAQADHMVSQSVVENSKQGSPLVNEANSGPSNTDSTHKEALVNSQDASHQVESVVNNMKDKETISSSGNVETENSKEIPLPQQDKSSAMNKAGESTEAELMDQKTPKPDARPQSSVEISRANAVLSKEMKSHHLPKTFLKRQQANLDRLQKIMEGIEMLQKIDPVESMGQLKDNDMASGGKQYSKLRTKGQKGPISDGCPHGTIYKRNWMKGGKKGKPTAKRLTKKDCMPIPHVARPRGSQTNSMYSQDAKESIASIKNRHDYQELAGEQAGGNPNDVAYYFNNNDRDKKEGDMLLKTKDNVFADTQSNVFDNGDYLRAAENMLRSDYQMAYSEAKAAFDKSTHEIQRLGDTGKLPFRTDKRHLQTRNAGKKIPAEVNTERYRRVMPMAKPTKAKKKS